MDLFNKQMKDIYGSSSLHGSVSGSGSYLRKAVLRDKGTTSVVLGMNSGSSSRGLPWDLTSARGHGLCFSTTGEKT